MAIGFGSNPIIQPLKSSVTTRIDDLLAMIEVDRKVAIDALLSLKQHADELSGEVERVLKGLVK